MVEGLGKLDGEEANIVSAGMKVEDTLKTDGWRDVIEPMLDQMITDTIGGKVNGRWKQGLYKNSNCSGYDAKELMAYSQALIDLQNRVYLCVDEAENIKQLKSEQGKGGKQEDTYFGSDESAYNPNNLDVTWGNYSAVRGKI